MADHQPLLSDLCSICHTKTPSYRCPGCSARTCSLPCYKRHQQLAQCSGKRDPAAYLRKAQLATPSGIDRDYNFISGIERAITKTDEQIRAKSIGTGIDKLRPNRHGQLSSHQPRSSDDRSALAKRLEQRRVIVEKAPLGMSRQRSNRTRVLKHRQLLWTVEWLMHDDTCHLDEILEEVPISLAYDQLIQRKADKANKAKKRKREVKSDDAALALQSSPKPAQHLSEDVGSHDVNQQEQSAEAEVTSNLNKEDVEDEKPQSAGDLQVDPTAKNVTIVPSDVHFYLVKPQTQGSRRVLIPLQPEATLETCLEQQVVLEFPTIQVLSQPAEQLSDGYMLESDYFKSLPRAGIRTGLPQTGALSAPEEDQNESVTASVPLDEQKLLKVLKQDTG